MVNDMVLKLKYIQTLDAASKNTRAVLYLLILLLAMCCLGACTVRMTRSIRSLAWQDPSYLWVCRDDAVWRYDVTTNGEDQWTCNCSTVSVYGDLPVWAVCDGEAMTYTGGKWRRNTPEEGVLHPWQNVVLRTNDGTIWIGGAGLARYVPTASEWTTVIPPLPNVPSGRSSGWIDEVREGKIYDLVRGQDGAVWAASSHGVIRVVDDIQQTWTTADGLPSNIALTLLQTRDGAVWVGTDQGLAQWADKTWVQVPYPVEPDTDGERTTTNMMEDAAGGVWVTTWSGVARWNGIQWQTWPVVTDLSTSWGIVDIVQTIDGNVWIATEGKGIGRWTGGQWRFYDTAEGLDTSYIKVLLQDPYGVLWAGGADGRVYSFDSTRDRWSKVQK